MPDVNTIALFVFLIALSGFFSGVEIAYFSLGRGKVRTMVRHRLLFSSLVESLKKNPRRLLTVILVGNNLVNVLAAALATEIAISVFGSRGVGIATGVVTFLLLVFGEIFPKTLSQIYAGFVSRYSAPAVFALTFIFFPVVWVLEKLADLFSIKAPERFARRESKIMEEEIKSLFQIGVEEGSLEGYEKEFAERLFGFNDAPVSTVAKPIEEAEMLDGDESIENAVRTAAGTGYSRFPVFRSRRGNIVGIAHIKDIIKAGNSEDKGKPLASIAQPPLLVSESDKLDNVFRAMRRNRSHYALVKNSAGALIALVTMEDILEELVGEIYDESDIRKKGIVT